MSSAVQGAELWSSRIPKQEVPGPHRTRSLPSGLYTLTTIRGFNVLPVALKGTGKIDASANANTLIEGSLLDLLIVSPH